MTDIFDYLNWRGDLPMQTVPMNEVDGMVFARIAYLPFEAFDVLHGETTVKDAAASLLAADDPDGRIRQKTTRRCSAHCAKATGSAMHRSSILKAGRTPFRRRSLPP